jgi:hypothetical protein
MSGKDKHHASWKKQVVQDLPRMGHRNWIAIVDSAYPWQTRPGIETLATEADQIQVVESVLKALKQAEHVQPIVYLDAELPHVAEADAPGIDEYREGLKEVLADRNVNWLAHEKIIAKLDEAAALFHVLVLKTNLALPYTSVFLQLDCGYWNAEAEQRLRQAFSQEGAA